MNVVQLNTKLCLKYLNNIIEKKRFIIFIYLIFLNFYLDIETFYFEKRKKRN